MYVVVRAIAGATSVSGRRFKRFVEGGRRHLRLPLAATTPNVAKMMPMPPTGNAHEAQQFNMEFDKRTTFFPSKWNRWSKHASTLLVDLWPDRNSRK
jgi:hypothetical protein